VEKLFLIRDKGLISDLILREGRQAIVFQKNV
jgi:hypothetical protein